MAAIPVKKAMGKCPVNKMKPCNPECAWYRKVIRYPDNDPAHPYVVELCAMNAIADAMDNNIMRLLGVQQEINVLRNQAEKTVRGLVQLGQAKQLLEKEIAHQVEHRVMQRLTDGQEEIVDMEEVEPQGVEAKISDSSAEGLQQGLKD